MEIRQNKMKKILLVLFCLLYVPGCDSRNKPSYPDRPSKTPYYYNETSIREMDQIATLTLRMARQKTGIEFVTVILKTLPENIPTEQYAAGLFQKWRIGSKTNGKGVLILFVEDTHTLKIEVSYELEGVFTDAYCASFQPTMKAYYAGKYFGDVFCNMVECLERRILVQEDLLPVDYPQSPDSIKSSDEFLSGGAGITDNEFYYEKDAKLSFVRQISPDKIKEFDCDTDIRVVLSRYFKCLEEGINYPFLGIFSEGSQLMRLEYPHSESFYKARYDDCRRSFPYKIKYKKELAALVFSKHQSFPIFLRKTHDGYWKVEEVRAWVSSWQDFSDNNSGPIYYDHPWMFAYSEYGYMKSRCNVPSLIPTTVSLKKEIARLEEAIRTEPRNPQNYFRLADIFYWDCLWIRASIELVERGLLLDPDNVPYRWLVTDMRYRFPSTQPNAEHFRQLLRLDPHNSDALYYYSRHQWLYEMNYRQAVCTLRKVSNARYKLYLLNFFIDNYWKELAVYKAGPMKIICYIWIFYISDTIIFVCLAAAVTFIILISGFICARLRRRRKLQLNQSPPCLNTAEEIPQDKCHGSADYYQPAPGQFDLSSVRK